MRVYFSNRAGFWLLLGFLLSFHTAGNAGIVTTLGAPTSTVNSTGNLPSWNNNGDREDATFTAYIDFSANTTPGSRQLIWESGGRVNGASLIYENNSLLRLRTLQSGTISELSWQLTANQIAAGELFVGWVIDLGSDELRLIMDGINGGAAPQTVATTTFTGTDWTGGGAAAFGDGSSRAGGYRGGSSFFPDAFSSGTINTTTGLNYYRDQAFLPSPIPEPMGVMAWVAAIGFTCFRRRRAAA